MVRKFEEVLMVRRRQNPPRSPISKVTFQEAKSGILLIFPSFHHLSASPGRGSGGFRLFCGLRWLHTIVKHHLYYGPQIWARSGDATTRKRSKKVYIRGHVPRAQIQDLPIFSTFHHLSASPGRGSGDSGLFCLF